jgi:hypothetical protein
MIQRFPFGQLAGVRELAGVRSLAVGRARRRSAEAP